MIKDYDPNNRERVRITSGNQTTHIPFSKEELEDLLSNLEQCESEGYLNYGDPAFNAFMKIKEGLKFYE